MVFFKTWAYPGFFPATWHSFMELGIYDVIKIAYRSRLLFGTDLEYREYLGVSFETISDNHDDERMMNLYYDMLDKECLAQTGRNLYAMVASYLKASEISRSTDFDWKGRKQIASRKKFVRMLFRMSAAPGVNLSVEEILKFRPKDGDKELIESICPEGFAKDGNIDLVFLMLITFGIIKPYSPKMKRRNANGKEQESSLLCMIGLVDTIKEDMPRIGVFPKPLIFDTVPEVLQSAKKDLAVCTPAWFWNLLNLIEDACISNASPSRVAESMLELTGLSMPGIWVDDKDNGQSRFWIFPENKYMAFCFSGKNGSWQLTPYEFCFHAKKYKTHIDEVCAFVTAKGNRQVLSSSDRTMDSGEVVTLPYELVPSDEYASFGEIRFESDATERPSWFDWNSFKRLLPDAPLSEEYSGLVAELYDSSSPRSVLLTNNAAFITDVIDCLIAIDNDYLYVSDIRHPEKCILKRDADGSDMYWYLPCYKSEPPRNLIDLEVSDEHPLYVFPRNIVSEFKIPDRYRRFVEAVDNTEIDDQISIYETVDTGQKIICFNRFSCIYVIDDLLSDLSQFGVRRLTSFIRK